jgi:chorismate dehydratase
MSVILALRGPLEDLDNAPLYLTNESASSVQLLKLILENEGLSPEYRPWKTEDAKELPWDAIGGLLIGDVALEWIYHLRSPMFIDLGEYWYTWTGQPFVFAVWAVRKDISKEFSRHISQLYNFFNLSVEDASFAMNSIAKRVAAQLNLPLKLVQRYFECLSYRFGVAEIEGMRRFFHLLNAKGVLESKVNIRFVET